MSPIKFRLVEENHLVNAVPEEFGTKLDIFQVLPYSECALRSNGAVKNWQIETIRVQRNIYSVQTICTIHLIRLYSYI
jgi:hypothetical protein